MGQAVEGRPIQTYSAGIEKHGLDAHHLNSKIQE